MADAGQIIGGKWLGRLFGFGQLLVLIFIMAAHITSFTIMMNVLTGHSLCSIISQLSVGIYVYTLSN